MFQNLGDTLIEINAITKAELAKASSKAISKAARALRFLSNFFENF